MLSLKSRFPKPIYLGAATRTPIGKFGGSLKEFGAAQLATLALKEARTRAEKSGSRFETDFVFLGHARQAGGGPNTARQATIAAGLPDTTPAITVNQACASGMTAIFWAIEKIALGIASNIWAGGTESMSNTPYLLPDVRWGYRLGNANVVDGMRRDGFFCPMAQMLMGETVEEYIAKARGITREAQDAYALESQKRAARAHEAGLFGDEIFPISHKNGILTHDEHMRADSTLEGLKKLPPVFNPKTGTVTAGNSSGITDGAAFVHVSSEKHAQTQAEILDYETVALDPRVMGLGPVGAISNILKRQKIDFSAISQVEINEAFAAQVLACRSDLKIPEERLNPRGGAIALGHPIGCSGTRVTVTLIHALKPGQLGIASLCVSGGQGVALLIKKL